LNTVDDGELSQTFAALADPTRRAILARLAQGNATVNVLAGPFPMSLQAVSRHLKVLEEAGLITRGREAQFRPCAFREVPLEEAIRWIEENRETWRRGMDQVGTQEQAASAAAAAALAALAARAAPAGPPFAPRGDWAR
jgi:DNA-binding transcriptional ArsR family regulator